VGKAHALLELLSESADFDPSRSRDRGALRRSRGGDLDSQGVRAARGVAATHYRRRRPPVLGPRPPRPSPPNALGQAEREHIVSVLRSQEYCDLAPAQIWARLLEPGGSVREEPVTHCRVCRHLCRCFPTMVAVDYSRPLEAVIPGTTGKVLGVLARTYAELPIRRVAQLGGVSRDRASIEIRRLVVLGIVSRREVAGASS